MVTNSLVTRNARIYEISKENIQLGSQVMSRDLTQK